MIGTTLAHYRITARLGAGAMGEVYRATDTRLGRDVALKILPAELARDAERLKRFRREARTLAVLSHPHIVTIFSTEEAADVHFLTMELVNGRGLDELISTDGGLPRDTLYEVGVQLCDAVAAAHERGIVHRDLKPANVMLAADGRLKVLDFGVAKVALDPQAVRTETQLLESERIVGTAAYMSPEQAQGLDVDERSDVFSLGTLLYELATGRRPFQGDSIPALLFAVVTSHPPPVSQSRPELAELDALLRECLVKSADDRRLTAAGLRDRLRALRQEPPGTGRAPTDGQSVATSLASPRDAAADPTTADPPRAASTARWRRPVIAVLPFISQTRDAELEDFAASLASTVVDGVANTSQAVVLPGSATRRVQHQDQDVRALGAELGATYLLQGTVRRGARLRVAVQLTSVESGTQIWSRQYDRELADRDLFDVGDEVASEIVSAVSDVHGVIFEIERQRLEGRPISELDPWECIFVTLGYDKFIDQRHHRIASEALARAVALDPGFALAWGYTSWIATDEHLYGFNARPDPLPRARAAARRAIELDPYSHMLRWLHARVLFFEGDVEGFLSEGNRALELNANDATVVGLIGMYSSLSGHWARGEALMRRAMALNPSYPSYYHMAIGLDRYREGRDDEALAEYRRLTFANPFVLGILAAICARLGRRSEATAALADLAAQMTDITTPAMRAMYERWNVRGELLETLLRDLERAGAG